MAAREAFAEHGYRRATMRLIGAQAGVDPALVHHYFGTKENLFAAAVKLPTRPVEAVDDIFSSGLAEVPLRLTRFFFRIWETPETREALLGQLRLAIAEDGPPPMRDFIVNALIERIAERLGGDDVRLRLDLVASHLVGVAILRYVVRVEPLASTDVDVVVAEVAQRVASYLLTEAPPGAVS